MRSTTIVALAAFLLLAGCERREPLTPQRAEKIIRDLMFSTEPVYAEVPQKVWFGPQSPKDDYDGLAVRTLHNLERAGLVTVAESHTPDGMTTYQAKVTQTGFHILGTMPSMRGPVYRGRICEKRLDGIRKFMPHPTDPTIGSAEIVWHYDKATSLYPLFETKMNKPLNKPFISLASLRWEKGAWRMQLIVRKGEAS